MKTLRINAGQIPSRLNTRQLRDEIAAALGLSIVNIEVQAALGGLRVIRSSPAGTTEEVFDPYLDISVPDSASVQQIEVTVAAHYPDKDDAEEVAASNAAQFKAQLTALANDPEMVALIKAAAAS